VEKRRGLGMFVKDGARKLLLQGERQKFLTEEWPRVSATIQRLGLTAQDLLNDGGGSRSSKESSASAEEETKKP
jgi:GntR family transcriptional regulator